MFGNYNKDYVFEDKEDAANSNEIIEKSKNSKVSSRSPHQFDTSKIAQGNMDSNQDYTYNISGENSNKNSDSINHTSGAPEIRKNTPSHEYS
jgi:hypothetical protein